jgi:hypothetical protein
MSTDEVLLLRRARAHLADYTATNSDEIVALLIERVEDLRAEVDRLKVALYIIRDDDSERGHPCDPPQRGHFARIADEALSRAP